MAPSEAHNQNVIRSKHNRREIAKILILSNEKVVATIPVEDYTFDQLKSSALVFTILPGYQWVASEPGKKEKVIIQTPSPAAPKTESKRETDLTEVLRQKEVDLEQCKQELNKEKTLRIELEQRLDRLENQPGA